MARTSPPRGFVPEIDGLRGIAILLVMIHRFWPRAGGLAAYDDVMGIGWIGVDLFFVVSGFLITGILLETRDDPHYLKNFYARRVLRIFPLFYLLVGGALVVFPLFGSAEYLQRAGSPLWYLLQLGNIPEGVLRHDPPYWLAPVWSLAIEEQFYWTFPHLVRGLDRRRLAKVLIGAVVLAPIVRTIGAIWFPQLDRFQYEFTLCRVDAIALGCLLALVVRRPAANQPRSHLLAVIAIVTAGVAVGTGLDRSTMFGRTLGYSAVAAGLAAIVLLVLRARGGKTVGFLRLAPLRYIGKLCFGLYLLHRPADTLVGLAAERLSMDPLAGWLVLIKLALAIGLASISWFALERPCLRLKRHFTSSRHPTGSPARAVGAAAVLLVALGACHQTHVPLAPADACTPGCRSADGPSPLPADARSADAVSADAAAMLDASIAPDAPADAGATSGIVLYPEGRRHSPITPQLAAHLAAMVGPSSAPRVFAKVGDSITASTDFLTCFDGSADLGAHAALAPTLAYFAAGNAGGTTPYGRTSLAATGGWTAHDVLAGSPSPLDQELDAIDPRYAIVMFGTNDDRYGRTLDAFGEDMWTIVDEFCARGVIPILSTIPPSGDPDADARVPMFDGAIRALAQGYQVPLVDFHAELVNLPSRGLGSDGIHPSVAPSGACDLSDAGLQYGYNVRNLITLEALDRVRSALAGNAPDATAPVRTGTGTHADPVLAAIPVADLGDTRGGEATFSAYPGCGTVAHTGRELVYELDLPAAATLDAEVVRHAGDEVDVYVLAGSLSPTACKAGGGPTVTASVGPGRVYIVVDSVSSAAEGEFLLVVRSE